MISYLAVASLLLQLPNFRPPSPEPLPAITREPQVTYLDRTGAVIGVRGGRYAPPVAIASLPAHVPAAFVAIEDRRFYSHNGVDPMGIGRAIVANLGEGRIAEGGSTITQQLARNLYLNADQTAERKAREMVIAVQLEQKYSKREILGLYLSRVYYGGGAYGIEAAAQRYFGKPAARLTIKEAAILAGTLKSPTAYNPAENPKAAGDRAALVLAAMQDTGAITPAQRAAALKEVPRVFAVSPQARAQYFVDWADAEVRQRVRSIRSDLTVETTLDLAVTQAAAVAAAEGAGRARGAQAAVVAVDGQGKVRVMVGGLDYTRAPYNRATTAKRQAGSAWKPFVYLAALESGMTPDSLVVDEPVNIGGWRPANYTPGYAGSLTMEQALARSVNTVAAGLADDVGRGKVADAARRAGIVSTVNTDPAMALGTSLVTPLEMAAAYASFANGGLRVAPYGVERVRQGTTVVYQARPAAPAPAINNPALSDLNRMLRTAVATGTGTRAQIRGRDIAGKTGTTSDYKDAWFCGHTGGLAMAVWLGRDDNAPMGTVTGGTIPAEIWQRAMTAAVGRLPVQPIPAGPAAPPPRPVFDPLGALLNSLKSEPRPEAPRPVEPTPLPEPPKPAEPAPLLPIY